MVQPAKLYIRHSPWPEKKLYFNFSSITTNVHHLVMMIIILNIISSRGCFFVFFLYSWRRVEKYVVGFQNNFAFIFK
jgi:hypothetical protein